MLNGLIKMRTFDTFITDISNKDAYEACKAISAQETSIHPILLLGCSGCGKSHLLMAIKDAVQKSTPACKVLYISVEELVFNYITRTKEPAKALSDYLGQYDVLLIDDIQSIECLTETQNILFNVLKLFVANGKRVVVAGECMYSREKGFVGAFAACISTTKVCKILPPSNHLKTTYAVQTADELGVSMSDSIVSLIDQSTKLIQIKSGLLRIRCISSAEEPKL